jgi:UDP-glucose 6-dehydrogenase
MEMHTENSELKISTKRLIDEPRDIQEVVNFNKDKKKRGAETVLSRLSEIQVRLTNILGLSLKKNSKLG